MPDIRPTPRNSHQPETQSAPGAEESGVNASWKRDTFAVVAAAAAYRMMAPSGGPPLLGRVGRSRVTAVSTVVGFVGLVSLTAVGAFTTAQKAHKVLTKK